MGVASDVVLLIVVKTSRPHPFDNLWFFEDVEVKVFASDALLQTNGERQAFSGQKPMRMLKRKNFVCLQHYMISHVSEIKSIKK